MASSDAEEGGRYPAIERDSLPLGRPPAVGVNGRGRTTYCLAISLLVSLTLNVALVTLAVLVNQRGTSYVDYVDEGSRPPPLVCWPRPPPQSAEGRDLHLRERVKCIQAGHDLHGVISKALFRDMGEGMGSPSELSTEGDWRLVPENGDYFALSIRVLSPCCYPSNTGNFVHSIVREQASKNPVLCGKSTLSRGSEGGDCGGNGDDMGLDLDGRLSIVAGVVTLREGDRLQARVNENSVTCRDPRASYFTLMKV